MDHSKIDIARSGWPDERREGREELMAHPEWGPIVREAGLTLDDPYSEDLQEMLLVEEALGGGPEIHDPEYVSDEEDDWKRR